MKRIYLDWAAAAPISKKAERAFLRALPLYGNPLSVHTEGQKASLLLEDARTRIARLAGVKADAIVFTSGATEANNLAIKGVIAAHLQAGKKANELHVLHLSTGHASTVKTVEALRAEGIQVEPIALSGFSIDLAAFKMQLRPETVLVCVDAVCGETGTRFNTREIGTLLEEQKAPRPLLHVDASQLPLIESIERTRLKADLVTLDAQKVGAVRGIGVLIAPRSVHLTRITEGGGQERELRPGTPSPALAQSFATALEEALHTREQFSKDATQMKTALIQTLTKEIPSLVINASKESAPHILNFSLIGRDTDYAVMLLDRAGYAISTRSACETDASGSRPVHMMTKDDTRAASTLRVSWGPKTSKSSLRSFARALVRTVRFLDANAL